MFLWEETRICGGNQNGVALLIFSSVFNHQIFPIVRLHPLHRKPITTKYHKVEGNVLDAE